MRLIIGLVLALAMLGCDKTIREVRNCADRAHGAAPSCIAAGQRQQ